MDIDLTDEGSEAHALSLLATNDEKKEQSIADTKPTWRGRRKREVPRGWRAV
jgi:hypothetical protein